MDELAEKREDIRKNTKASWQHKAIKGKAKGMSKKTMSMVQKGDLGGFMKQHYPK